MNKREKIINLILKIFVLLVVMYILGYTYITSTKVYYAIAIGLSLTWIVYSMCYGIFQGTEKIKKEVYDVLIRRIINYINDIFNLIDEIKNDNK